MKLLKIAGYAGAGLVAVCLGIAFLEAMSVHEHYELEPARVRKVVKNPSWGFIGHDEMTLVRFEDGFDTQIAGNRGEPGDKILAGRQRGTRTMLHILERRESK
jgi:hypothetical protein